MCSPQYSVLNQPQNVLLFTELLLFHVGLCQQAIASTTAAYAVVVVVSINCVAVNHPSCQGVGQTQKYSQVEIPCTKMCTVPVAHASYRKYLSDI